MYALGVTRDDAAMAEHSVPADGAANGDMPESERARLAAMLDNLDLFGMGFSWGGYESLVLAVNPSAMRSATAWTADGPTLRIHAGLEDIDDLIADFEQALDAV